MGNTFVDAMFGAQYSLTANGAKTWKDTGSSLLDLFSTGAAMRGKDILPFWKKAYAENADLAIVVAFYLRDVRGGQREKKIFADILAWLKANDRARFEKIVALVPFYGYWKELTLAPADKAIEKIVVEQLKIDMKVEKPSLLAKYMPSENAGNAAMLKARYWMGVLGWGPKRYRTVLSGLRRKLGTAVAERFMSAREFGALDYSKMPSRAFNLYKKALQKHEPERFAAFMAKAAKGEVKVNTSGVYPYEIVHSAQTAWMDTAQKNAILAQWASMVNTFEVEGSFLPVADTSGSMGALIPGTKVTMESVAVALSLLLAEKMTGPFKDLMLAYSDNAHPIRLSGDLFNRIGQANTGIMAGGTNLQSVFDFIIKTAKNSDPNDAPQNIVIFSDMEFNVAINKNSASETNLKVAQDKFARAGLKFPRVIYWNLNGRAGNAPARANENGIVLVGGFAPDIMNKVLGSKATTPFDTMMEVLFSERYQPVRLALA